MHTGVMRWLMTIASVSGLRLAPTRAAPPVMQMRSLSDASRYGGVPGQTAAGPGANVGGRVVPTASLAQKVDTLVAELGLTKTESLADNAAIVVETIGLKDVEKLNLKEKVDACLDAVGVTADSDEAAAGAMMARRPRTGGIGGLAYGWGSPYYGGGWGGGYGMYSPWGGPGYGYGYSPWGGYGGWGGYGYGYGGYGLARRAYVYDRARFDWTYDPFQAVGESWAAYNDFFY